MLKKATSGVLVLLPCSRTESTLRAPKRLRPRWTNFFDHSSWLLTSIVPLAFTGHGSNIFNKPNIYREGGPVEKRTFPFYPRSSLPIITTRIIVFPNREFPHTHKVKVSAREVGFSRICWKTNKAAMKYLVRHSRNFYCHGVEIAEFGGLRISVAIGSPYHNDMLARIGIRHS